MCTVPAKAMGMKVLVYTRFGKGFVHTCVNACADAVVGLGRENGFCVDVSDDPGKFTDENLKQYAALVFDNTNNEIFDTEDQKSALQRYVRAGGGVAGIHSASGGMRNWAWYAQLIGARFEIHPPAQPLTIRVVDAGHQSTSFIKDPWQWQSDECYFHKGFCHGLRMLLCVEVETLKPHNDMDYEKLAGGRTVPISWCHEFEGGRAWFTGLGHDSHHYSDPMFRKHILGGLQWAMGRPER